MNTDTGEIREMAEEEVKRRQANGEPWVSIPALDVREKLDKLISDPTVKRIVIRKNRLDGITAVIPYR